MHVDVSGDKIVLLKNPQNVMFANMGILSHNRHNSINLFKQIYHYHHVSQIGFVRFFFDEIFWMIYTQRHGGAVDRNKVLSNNRDHLYWN
jgi:hypothetical protein